MSNPYRKKLNAQSKYINPPVHAKQKVAESRIPTGRPVVMYKMDKGPLKETTTEKQERIRVEAEKRWLDNQAKKEAYREARRLEREAKGHKPRGRDAGFIVSDATKVRMRKSQKKRWAKIRAESKNKSTALVITITITDPNKS